jgi:ferritin-like metal-binding protein YciE
LREIKKGEEIMAIDNLADAFYDELRDVLSAEKQIVKALRSVMKHVSSDELRTALSDHLSETEQHVERLEQAFEDTGKSARAKTCEAMKGLLKEVDAVLADNEASPAKDAVIIAGAQKVEHYEIATYGTLCTWARALGYTKALGLLEKTMDEEEKADKKLSSIAASINAVALNA